MEAFTVQVSPAEVYPDDVRWHLLCDGGAAVPLPGSAAADTYGNAGAGVRLDAIASPGAKCNLTMFGLSGEGWHGAVWRGFGQSFKMSSGWRQDMMFVVPKKGEGGGGAAGDPHVHFAHGGQADYRGEDDAIVCFFSAPGIALNIKTEDATFTPPWWRDTTIDGSYITEAHLVARVGGAKRKWANISFIASRLTEYNTGPDFIAGSCGGHAFSFGLGTTLRRCEELSIKPHYSSAKFEVATITTPAHAFIVHVVSRPHLAQTFHSGARLDLHHRGQHRWVAQVRAKAPA